MPGIATSMRTTSGCKRRAICSPSRPSQASPQIDQSEQELSTDRIPRRTSSWSSTMSIFRDATQVLFHQAIPVQDIRASLYGLWNVIADGYDEHVTVIS